MTVAASHRWRFFRAGGFDQVQLATPLDLAALRSLDQKLWAALACPVDKLEFDKRTLTYIDSDGDGRIRAPEVIAAVEWTLARLADPATLFRDEPFALSSLRDDATGQRLRQAAQRLLRLVGRPADPYLTPADTDDLARLFPPDQPNGDGLVPPALSSDESLKAAMADILRCMGAEKDRSGEDALSETAIKDFFAQAARVQAWQQRCRSAELQPFGERTAEVVAAITVLREKIDDYFHRVELAAFDPRAATLMNGEEGELVKLAARNLANVAETAGLPLAGLHHGGRLPLKQGTNPAWSQAMQAFREKVVQPLLGDIDSLTAADWRALTGRCTPYFAWQADKPEVAILEELEATRIVWMVEQGIEEQLLQLVQQDRVVGAEADSLIELDKLLRFQQHLVTLLNNFVSFRDFYTRSRKAVFQAGKLFIDGKSCDLVVEVAKPDEHYKMAAASSCFLVYCCCTRRQAAAGDKQVKHIVAAVTNGSEGNLLVGRNGVFYDRDGHDWDANVVRLIENAISIREAFWTPYRRIASLVSEQIQKLAASRNQELVSQAAGNVGTTLTTTAAPAAVPPPTAANRAFDIAKFAGIFAAIGLALGALGTVATAIVAGLLALKWWQLPLVVLAVMLVLSGPSMLLAWFKLRRRNLAPILDANGWAVNTQARLSIGFGAVLTQLAQLPPGARRVQRDPYTNPRPLWPWLLLGAVALALWWTWRQQWLWFA